MSASLWFLFALGGPILWAASNFVDKALLERLRAIPGPQVLIMYSSLFSVFVIPITFVLSNRNPLLLDASTVGTLVVAGIVEMASIGLYLYALAREEASIVVPLFQTIPFFSYLFGYVFLEEILTFQQSAAVLIVIAGAVILTLEFQEEHRVRLKTNILLLCLASAAGLSLFDALFKVGALSGTFWASVFWQHVGILACGLALSAVKKEYRSHFFESIRSSGFYILGVNAINETLYVAGTLMVSFALLLAPIALVATVSIYQPVFVFLFGILLTILFPHIVSEKISRAHLAHKGVAIVIILCGSALLLT